MKHGAATRQRRILFRTCHSAPFVNEFRLLKDVKPMTIIIILAAWFVNRSNPPDHMGIRSGGHSSPINHMSFVQDIPLSDVIPSAPRWMLD